MKPVSCEDLQHPYLFVSYSRDDAEKVHQTLKLLEQNRVRFWYDEDIPSGSIFAETLAIRIEECAQLLLFVSRTAISSKYVLREVQYAIEMDKSILVIYLDDAKLERRLAFLLGGIHAIRFDDPRFREKLFSGIPKETIRKDEDGQLKTDGSEGSAAQQCRQLCRIQQCIGQGGFGSVHLAEHVHTGALVVVKHGVKDNTYAGSMVEGAFRTEARILASLQCPYVPTVMALFQDSRDAFLVESYLPGRNLAQLIQEGDFTQEETVDIGMKLLHVLSYFTTEEYQVVHKDIKPSNIILNSHGDVSLIDFGSGQITNLRQGWRKSVHSSTPGYAPPEQYSGGIDWRGDLYSIGKTLQRLLTAGSGAAGTRGSYPLRYFRPDCSPGLERVLCTMTDPDPLRRYESLEEAESALSSCLRISRRERMELQRLSDKRLSAYRQETHWALTPERDLFTMSDASAAEITMTEIPADAMDGETMPIHPGNIRSASDDDPTVPSGPSQWTIFPDS